MRLVQMDWHPQDRQLRQFGIVCLFALPLVGWLWSARIQTVSLLAAIGFVLAVVGLLCPKVLKLLYLPLALLAMPIGLVLSEVTLVLIYVSVFVPMGMIFRLMKRDSLQLRRDGNAQTYWRPKKQPHGVASYYRQW